MYPGAGFYGIREIFLAYAGLPRFLPLPVAVQHGWQCSGHAFEASAKPPEIWVWSPRMAAEVEVYYPAKRIRVVGSFYCYLKRLMKNELPQVEKRGSICIPPHSSHFTSTDYPIEEFVRQLDKLGDEFKPITVMLYYLDMNSQTVDMYESFGFKVVSNGSLFDECFLRRFVHNVYDKQHCLFSDLGSGVFFAADMGLNLVRFDIESRFVNRGNEHTTDEYISKAKMFDEEFFRSLGETRPSSELGESYMLSPGEMRKLIHRNYFTWRFVTRSARWVAGKVLRSMGLFSRNPKLT